MVYRTLKEDIFWTKKSFETGIQKCRSLRANSPIWASETSLARTRERAAKPRGASERLVLARLTSLTQIGELARRLKVPRVTELKLSVAVNSDTHSPDKNSNFINPSRGVLKRLTINMNAVQLNSHKKWVELRYPTNESDKLVASCTSFPRPLLFRAHATLCNNCVNNSHQL